MPKPNIIDEETYDLIKASSSYEAFVAEMGVPRQRMVAADNWTGSDVVAKLLELEPDTLKHFDEADLHRVASAPMRPDMPMFAAIVHVVRFMKESVVRRRAAAEALQRLGPDDFTRQAHEQERVFTEDTRGKREFQALVDEAKRKRGGPKGR